MSGITPSFSRNRSTLLELLQRGAMLRSEHDRYCRAEHCREDRCTTGRDVEPPGRVRLPVVNTTLSRGGVYLKTVVQRPCRGWGRGGERRRPPVSCRRARSSFRFDYRAPIRRSGRPVGDRGSPLPVVVPVCVLTPRLLLLRDLHRYEGAVAADFRVVHEGADGGHHRVVARDLGAHDVAELVVA